MRAGRTLAVLGAMYVAQGLVYGFAAFILLPTLAAKGVPLQEQTGIVALAGVPWVFKLLWGPVVDTWAAGDRGPPRLAVAALWIVAACLVVLGAIAPTSDNTPRLAATWLALNVALSLQDVAVDAIALDRIAPEQRGIANGVMLAGHHVGVEGLGGIALGAFVASRGLQPALWAMAGAVLLLALAPMWIHGPDGLARARTRTFTETFATLRRVVADHRALAVGAVAAGVMFADVLTAALSGEFWVKRLHWSVEDVGARLPWVLLPANVVGYLVAGRLADRIGHRKLAAYGTVALGASWAVFAALSPWWTSVPLMLGFVAVQTLATATMYVGVHAVLMDATAPDARATHFAVLTSLLNSPRIFAPLLAAPALATMGYRGLFVACAAMQAAWALALVRLPGRASLSVGAPGQP